MNFDELLNSKAPKIGRVKLIAVDGHGGSGKSTVAKILSEKLQAEIIEIDDFTGRERPKDWPENLITTIFGPIAAKAATISYRRAKWWPNHHPEPVVNQPVTPIMILEGVTALRGAFRPYISLAIFVDTPGDVSMQRGIERDLACDTGKTKEEIIASWRKWSESETKYMARERPDLFADIIVDGRIPVNGQFGLLTQRTVLEKH